MSILHDIAFEDALKEYKEVARKRAEGVVSKLQRLNHLARIRYGYISESEGPITQPATTEKSIERPAESDSKTESSEPK